MKRRSERVPKNRAAGSASEPRGIAATGRHETRPRWHVWGVRLALATAMATVLAYFPYKLLDGSSERKAEELGRQYQRTVEARRELAGENARLRREIEALKSDVSAIEDIARDELGMVRPGEVILRIDQNLGQNLEDNPGEGVRHAPEHGEPAPQHGVEDEP